MIVIVLVIKDHHPVFFFFDFVQTKIIVDQYSIALDQLGLFQGDCLFCTIKFIAIKSPPRFGRLFVGSQSNFGKEHVKISN